MFHFINAQEGFFVHGAELGMLPADVDVLPVAPAMALGGYSSVPSFDQSEGTQPVNAVGMRFPAEFLDGEREARSRVTVNLGTGAGPKSLLMAAFTDAPATLFPAANRHMCLPVLALGGGAMSACHSARSFTWLSRFNLINTLNLNFQYKQALQAQIATEAICIQRGAGVLNASQVNPTAIRTSGGQSLAWQHLKVYVGTFDLTRRLQSISIQYSNNITRDPAMRGELGDDNPLSRTSVGLSVGNASAGVNLNLATRLPDEMVDAAPNARYWANLGPIVVEAIRGGYGWRFTLPSNILSSYNQQEVQAQGRFSYAASLAATDLGVAYMEA